MSVLTPIHAWAIFVNGTDYTDFVDADEITVRTRAHAQTGTLTAQIRDEAATLPVATDQEVILMGRVESGGATSLAAASSASATNIKVTAVTGFAAGDEIVIGDHPTAEIRFISTVGTAGAGGTGITVSPALTLAHGSGHQVYEAERLFAGFIRRRTGQADAKARIHDIVARDYTDLLGQDVIDVAFRSTTESDKARVTWLIQTWGFKGVTAGTEVIQTLATMPPGEDGSPEQDFSGKSLQRAIEQIEKITGAEHYVDFYKRLHYFTSESNAAPYSLSTSPNYTTSWPFFDFKLPEDSVEKVNAVYIYGAELESGQIRGWRPASPPPAATRVAVVIRDADVTSTAQLAAVGDAYLADHSTNEFEGSLRTWRSGFRAGQTVQITNPYWGLSATSFYIQEVTLKIENGQPLYDINFGSAPPSMSGQIGGAVKVADSALRIASGAVPAAVGAVGDLSVAGSNLVPNSSIESASSVGWAIGSGWTYGYIPVSPERAYSGVKVARLDTAGAAAGELVTPLMSVDRLDDWWCSYWSFLRSRSSGSVTAKVRQFNAAGADLGADLTLASPGSTVEALWTRHSLHLGPNTEFGRTAFHANAASVALVFDDASTGTLVWDVDGLQVERGRLITSWAPMPYELIDGSVTGDMIAGGTITETNIAPDSITTPLLAAGAVATDKLAANAVVAGKIAAGAITAQHIAASGISADQVRSGQLILGGVTDLASFPTAIGGTNPIAWWRMNEDAGDLVNSGSLGVVATAPVTGDPLRQVPGLLTRSSDTAMTFDGTDHAIIGGIPALTAFSIGGMVQPTAGSDGYILQRSTAAYLMRSAAQGVLVAAWLDASSVQQTITSEISALLVDEIHHVILTHDGSMARLYVDGLEVASLGTTLLTVPASAWGLAATSTGTTRWVGGLDELAIWDRAVTEAEILAMTGAALNPADGRIDYIVVYDADGDEIGRWGPEGLYITDEQNPLAKIRLVDGELQFANESDANGDPMWRTAISAEGIWADAIRIGTAPGGHNRVPNSGFELAAFQTPLTKIWTSSGDWGTTIGTDVNVTKTGSSLVMTNTAYSGT